MLFNFVENIKRIDKVFNCMFDGITITIRKHLTFFYRKRNKRKVKVFLIYRKTYVLVLIKIVNLNDHLKPSNLSLGT